MTDSEMWAEIAEGLKAVGDEALNGVGLCFILAEYYVSNVIGYKQHRRMVWQLRDAFGRQVDNNRYYWPAGQAAPRIKACLKLAKLTEGK